MEFGIYYTINPVSMCHSGPGVAENNFSLTCSATLVNSIPLPTNVPSPSFEWFYGPHGSNASLPSGATPMGTSMSMLTNNPNSITYTSTLQFSLLNQSHAGNYTCRLGAGCLVNSMLVSVDGMLIKIHITLEVTEYKIEI